MTQPKSKAAKNTLSFHLTNISHTSKVTLRRGTARSRPAGATLEQKGQYSWVLSVDILTGPMKPSSPVLVKGVSEMGTPVAVTGTVCRKTRTLKGSQKIPLMGRKWCAHWRTSQGIFYSPPPLLCSIWPRARVLSGLVPWTDPTCMQSADFLCVRHVTHRPASPSPTTAGLDCGGHQPVCRNKPQRHFW